MAAKAEPTRGRQLLLYFLALSLLCLAGFLRAQSKPLVRVHKALQSIDGSAVGALPLQWEAQDDSPRGTARSAALLEASSAAEPMKPRTRKDLTPLAHLPIAAALPFPLAAAISSRPSGLTAPQTATSAHSPHTATSAHSTNHSTPDSSHPIAPPLQVLPTPQNTAESYPIRHASAPSHRSPSLHDSSGKLDVKPPLVLLEMPGSFESEWLLTQLLIPLLGENQTDRATHSSIGSIRHFLCRQGAARWREDCTANGTLLPSVRLATLRHLGPLPAASSATLVLLLKPPLQRSAPRTKHTHHLFKA